MSAKRSRYLIAAQTNAIFTNIWNVVHFTSFWAHCNMLVRTDMVYSQLYTFDTLVPFICARLSVIHCFYVTLFLHLSFLLLTYFACFTFLGEFVLVIYRQSCKTKSIWISFIFSIKEKNYFRSLSKAEKLLTVCSA